MEEIEIDEFDAWNDFDQIAKIIRINHKGLIIQRIEGPDARIYQFSIDGIVFWLAFDDMAGMYLKTENKEDVEKLEHLAKEIFQTMKERYL